jgi:uncharacterized protein (DUF2062 family)
VYLFKDLLHKLLLKERCPDRLALSLALGAYIAFCPFVGLHTALVFAFAWMLSLNALVLLAISNGINNPLTMVPIYASGHMAGDWLLNGVLGYDVYGLDPSWMQWLNQKIVAVIGMPKLSLTAFMIGGNLLGILIAVLLYPIAQMALRMVVKGMETAKVRYRAIRGKK